MRHMQENELNSRIQTFLSKKLAKFPELREDVTYETDERPVRDQAQTVRWPFPATS